MKRNYCVYIHENMANGKKYVGITCKPPEHRWNRGKNYVGCSYFYAAVLKYGWDGFYHGIVARGLTRAEACQLETDLILKNQTNNENFGYNLTTGGESNTPNEATRKKMSEARKGRRFSEDHRRKIGQANRKRVLSEETKRKIAEKHTGMLLGADNPRARAVINLDTEEVYATIKEAAEKHEINYAVIGANCGGKLYSAGGSRWMFYDEYLNSTQERINEMKRRPIGIQNMETAYNKRKVINLNTGEVFQDIRSAGRRYNTDCSTIVKCCKGKVAQAKGHRWQYYEDYSSKTAPEVTNAN